PTSGAPRMLAKSSFVILACAREGARPDSRIAAMPAEPAETMRRRLTVVVKHDRLFAVLMKRSSIELYSLCAQGRRVDLTDHSRRLNAKAQKSWLATNSANPPTNCPRRRAAPLAG